MKLQIFSRRFTFISPLPPDEVIASLKRQIATSYPYYAKDGKPYRGSINGYSFEMERINDITIGGLSSRDRSTVKMFGEVIPDGSGSMVKVKTGTNIALIILLIFPVIGLSGFMTLLLINAGVVPMLLVFPMLIYAMIYRQVSVNWSNTKTFLHLLLKASEVT